jgi:pimeloyl-ACP methyl ester carboxylesterase
MLGMRGFPRHLRTHGAWLAVALATAASAQEPGFAGTSNFTILIGGSRAGTATTSVSHAATGWLITSTGRLLPPVDLVTTRFEVTYDADWQPRQLTIEALQHGQPLQLSTSFGLTTATADLTRNGQHASATQQIAPRAVVIAEDYFGAYEALAARLAGVEAGGQLPVYLAPRGEGAARVLRVTPRHIDRPEGDLDLREYVVTISGGAAPLPVELWIDGRNRLARLSLPELSLVMLRDDLASVMAREERQPNVRDENTLIPGNGFYLAGTLTKPAGSAAKAPAVVLVASPGTQDRDFVSYGIPVFAQLAGALSDSGVMVLRYDGRGVGQSGGRTENATLDEYAGDAIAAAAWLRKRDDVDDDRIAVIGYDRGGPVAMAAAAKDDHIKALALIAAPGKSGREVTLEQQERLLARAGLPPADQAGRIALQRRIVDAVVTGKGWENVPADVRQQSDTPWFRSWLLFDPAGIIPKIKAPILVVQGANDAETPPAYASRLAALARARKNAPPASSREATVPGVTHLLIPGPADTVDYGTLTDRRISTDLTGVITAWLADVFRTAGN